MPKFFPYSTTVKRWDSNAAQVFLISEKFTRYIAKIKRKINQYQNQALEKKIKSQEIQNKIHTFPRKILTLILI